MDAKSSNVKAGMFVIIGIVLAFAVIVALSDIRSMFTPMQEVKVYFSVVDGLKGLKKDAEVTVGDFPAGKVTVIEEGSSEQDVPGYIVTLALPDRYTLYENARIELVKPPLGAGTKLNIRDFGAASDKPGHAGANWEYELDVDPPIGGGLAPSDIANSFVRNLGIEDRQRLQIQNIIANIDRLSTALGEDPKPIEEIIANLRDTTESLREIMDGVQGRQEQWMASIDRITVAAVTALETAAAMLDENRADVREAIVAARAAMEHAEAITKTVRDQTIEKIHDALDKARLAVDDAREATGNLKSLTTAQRPVLERTLANMRIVSDQLKLASIEVRRSPWRLLYKPSEKELDTDNLYDAARSFALAASTLDTTSESLRAILDRYEQEIDTDDPDVQLMLDNLHESFERFIDAEKIFWEALDEQASP